MLSEPRTWRALVAGAFLLAFTVPAAADAATASQQLAPFAWLVGGAWRADTSSLPGGLKYIETRYDLAPNGRVIRFTTAFVNADGGVGAWKPVFSLRYVRTPDRASG